MEWLQGLTVFVVITVTITACVIQLIREAKR